MTQSSRKLALWVLSVLLLIGSAGACGKDSVPAQAITFDQTPFPEVQGTGLSDRSGNGTGIAAAIATGLVVKPQQVRILKSLSTGSSEVIALSRTSRPSGSHHSFGWLQEDDGLKVRQLAGTPTSDLFDERPTRGSGGSLLAPVVTDSGFSALVGFVDPALSRIDVVSRDGELVGRSFPMDGAVIVATEPWAQFRSYLGDEIAGVTLISPPSADKSSPPTTDIETGRVLLKGLAEGDLDEASRFLPEGAPLEVLEMLRDVLSSIGGRVGAGTGNQGATVFNVFGRSSKGQVRLFISGTGNAKKLVSYSYERIDS